MTLRLFLFLILSLGSLMIEGVQSEGAVIPLDPEVRTGKLGNGFTYYVRQNRMPEGRVEMRLAVNAGSVLEDDDQRGLAHFCEHMAFNGSEHFEKNQLISFLQSLGIQYGPELNAYTGFDETVYRLTLPSEKEELLETGLLVMFDWAQGLSFDADEIDKERGVIIEEWRLGRGAGQRMLDAYLPVLLGGSRYSKRLPIGVPEVIQGAPHDTLRRFYWEWYRPDLMALVVVGDVDPDEMVARIHERFSKLKPSVEPRERAKYSVPEHEDTRVVVVTDREAPATRFWLYYKRASEVLRTEADFEQRILEESVSGMLNQRLSEKLEQAEPPFVFGGYFKTDLVRPVAVWYGVAGLLEERVEAGIGEMMLEAKRAAQYGFVASEFERQKAVILRSYEKAFLERERTESEVWVDRLVEHYLGGNVSGGPELELSLAERVLERMTLDQVNEMARALMAPVNRVAVVTGHDRIAGTVDEALVRRVMAEVDAMEVEAYRDPLEGANLLQEEPEAGRVVSVEAIPAIDAKRVRLSNGVEVILKRTDLRNDEVLFSAFSRGGDSLYGPEDKYPATYAAGVVGSSGYGPFSQSDLEKLLAGKSVKLEAVIDSFSEGIEGSFSPGNKETFFQLLHLAFREPRYSEDAFSSYLNRMRTFLTSRMEDPQYYFSRRVDEVLSRNHPRARIRGVAEDLEKVEHARALELYRERFADADDFLMTIVGNFDEAALLGMLEAYVASLPVVEGSEDWVDHGVRRPVGAGVHEVFKGQDDKSLTVMSWACEAPWSREGALALQALHELLNIRLNHEIREKMGNVYYIGATTAFRRIPADEVMFTVVYPSAPDSVEGIETRVVEVLQEILDNGVTDEDIVKVRETLRRGLERKLQDNRYWLEEISRCARWGDDFGRIADSSVFDSIESDFVREWFGEWFDPGTFTRITLYPERGDEKAQEASVSGAD